MNGDDVIGQDRVVPSNRQDPEESLGHNEGKRLNPLPTLAIPATADGSMRVLVLMTGVEMRGQGIGQPCGDQQDTADQKNSCPILK